MAAAQPEGTVLAEGIYSYTVEERPQGSEMWRITQLDDGRLHIQALIGSGQRVLYGMDLLTNVAGAAESLTIQVPEVEGGALKHGAALHFTPGAVRGQVEGAAGRSPIDLPMPPGTLPYPASIALHFLIGRALDLEATTDRPLHLCFVPVPTDQSVAAPTVVSATATILGPEPVDLLMATIPATHVLIEIEGIPPQHAWFDERRFPVRWYWVEMTGEATSTAQEFSLSRYGWLG